MKNSAGIFEERRTRSGGHGIDPELSDARRDGAGDGGKREPRESWW